MGEGRALPVMIACVADDSATSAGLREALLTIFPDWSFVRVNATDATIPPGSHCAIIGGWPSGERGLDVLRRVRAGGYDGPAVLVLEDGHPDAASDASGASRVGARTVTLTGDFLPSLGEAVAEALRVYDGGGEGTPSARATSALRHIQRMVAAGEIAMDLRHALNNPLAALLAEAQLLELEPLAAEHKESVQRIISLTRRVVGVVRELDGVGRA